MPRCAILTTDNLEDFFVYDGLVTPHLAAQGWQVDEVSWHDQTVDYNEYDIVIVRSTWDYQAHYQAFVDTLQKIDESSARLENSLALMQWNVSKSYLRDLSDKGISILPTLWFDNFDGPAIKDAFSHFNSPEIIIKPLISANADFTYRLSEEDFLFQQHMLKEAFDGKEFMVQAFEKTIIEQGEYSLFYFNGEYSHAINKRPAKGDFRVQEEHGGELFSIEPTGPMRQLSTAVLKAMPSSALYARIDMLETEHGMAIIEVELIEPSLYFNMDKDSPARFAQAVINRMKN